MSNDTLDAMSRSIQRLRQFNERDFPPILTTQELDHLEKLLANLRSESAPIGDRLLKKRDEICRTIHEAHLHEVLVGFDMAAASICGAETT